MTVTIVQLVHIKEIEMPVTKEIAPGIEITIISKQFYPNHRIFGIYESAIAADIAMDEETKRIEARYGANAFVTCDEDGNRKEHWQWLTSYGKHVTELKEVKDVGTN